jgi:hypothetical protein
MNSGSYDFQVIFCALVLVALAAVAVIVDHLKGVNKRLRERHLELMARHNQLLQRSEEENTRLLEALGEQAKALREADHQTIIVSAVSGEPPASEPAVVLAPLPPAPPPPVEDQSPLANVVSIRPAFEELPKSSPEPNFDTFLEEVMDEFSAREPVEELNDAPPAAPEPDLTPMLALNVPAGVHPASALEQLMQAKVPFTGLTLAIGINYYHEFEEVFGREVATELLNTIDGLMASLVSKGGFLTRRAGDEFILLFEGLTGTEAHDHLTWISETLWDYQISTLDTYSVVFSWGAQEGYGDSIANSVDLAVEKLAGNRADRTDAGRNATV